MQEIKKLADSVKKQLNLKYDTDSVKFLEGFIERTKSDIPREQWQGLMNACGAFLGECIIANFGGQWGKDHNDTLCVCFDDNNMAYPFGKVAKQFENGLEDSIYSFYSAIPKVFRLEAKPKKKKWWKF